MNEDHFLWYIFFVVLVSPCTVFSHPSPESSANIVRRNFSGETRSLTLGWVLTSYHRRSRSWTYSPTKKLLSATRLFLAFASLEAWIIERIPKIGLIIWLISERFRMSHILLLKTCLCQLIYEEESITRRTIPTYYFIICGDSLFMGCDIII